MPRRQPGLLGTLVERHRLVEEVADQVPCPAEADDGGVGAGPERAGHGGMIDVKTRGCKSFVLLLVHSAELFTLYRKVLGEASMFTTTLLATLLGLAQPPTG